MKKLFYILIIFFLICLSCTISTEESSNCGEWEFEDNVPKQGFFGGVNWQCRPVLKQFDVIWSGQMDIVLESVDIHSQTVCFIDSYLFDDKTIILNFPLIDEDYYQQYGVYPEYEYALKFINWNWNNTTANAETLEFVIDSYAFDPFVQNTVSYNGSGQINNSNNNNPSLKFSFEYVFEGATYTVYFEGCTAGCGWDELNDITTLICE